MAGREVSYENIRESSYSYSYTTTYVEEVYEEYDEEEYEEDIDNADLTYSGGICIVLNSDFSERERRNKLRTSENVLCRKFPKLKQIPGGNRLQEILDSVFPEGFNKQMYIRNLTFKNQNSGRDIKILGIRPERISGDGIDTWFPEGVSLLFKGHIYGKQFIVDSIHETADTEQLDFEVDCIARPYKNLEMIIGGNFLYNILDEAGSLTEYTGEKLEEWKEYLKWKEELAKRQIFGCKYYKITFDEDKKRLIFWLVCENKEYFQAFRKYLGRDIQVFDNHYSSDKWRFKFSGDGNNKRQRYNSIEVGRFRGVVSEYYLKENKEEDNQEEDDTSVEAQNLYFEDENYYDEELDYNDDQEDGEETEQDIRQVFENPYIVEAAYELNRSDLDEINHRNLDEDGFTQYVYDHVLGNYHSNGFLALSAVGEFVLINRFLQAINQLERDECYSPNLAMWLFDVTRARLPEDEPDIVIDKWLNKKIEKNENQKLAVYKMLAAPDLCLIQGPPGTGKTTVIAEAIYQFVRDGNRVLVASQSNDAVDNALERLVDTPEIRAIRLGQKGRRRKNEDTGAGKFSEDETLRYYYNALSQQVSRTWLNMWDELERIDTEYDLDIRDAKLFSQDIADLNTALSKKNEGFKAAGDSFRRLRDEIGKANEYNTSLQNEIYQYKLMEDNFKGISDEQYYLSENMIRIFQEHLNPLVDATMKKGIHMTPGILDLDVTGSSRVSAYISIVIKNFNTLEGLKNKIYKSKGKSSQNDGEILILQRQCDAAKAEMMKCIDSGEDEGEARYKKEYLALKKQIDSLNFQSSVIAISDIEKNILSSDFQEYINNGDKDEVIGILDSVISHWHSAMEETLREIGRHYDSVKPVDVAALTEKLRVAKGRYEALKDEIQNTNKQIEVKRQTLSNICRKYGIKAQMVDEIIEHIRGLKEENLKRLQEQSAFRGDWEKTLRLFKERLDDRDSFKYDQEHYQQIYINACNVVGISCTDNMRNLTDNGYDDFDVVIIDEVSKATPPELLIPLMKARKAILVGDHRQLPPMFKEHEGSYKELTQNQDNVPEELRDLLTEENFKHFQNMVTSSLFKDYFEQADESIKHSLLVQYRMHSDIMNIINRFYEQRLENGLNPETEKLEKNHGLTIKGVDKSTFIVPERHAYWIDSSCLPSGTPIYETFINKSTSACNILEKHIIIELLKKIAEAYRKQEYPKDKRKKVGVISFYQMQVNELRDAFKNAKKNFDFSAIEVDINTVDRFQGKEKNIIITSLVRNNKEAKASRHVVAFERINVAFSRAQELLFIVGAKHMYENTKVELPNMDMPGFKTAHVYKNIMDDLQRKACFRTSSKIITPETEEMVIREYKENGGR